MAGGEEKPKGNAIHAKVTHSSVWLDSASNWWRETALYSGRKWGAFEGITDVSFADLQGRAGKLPLFPHYPIRDVCLPRQPNGEKFGRIDAHVDSS